MAASTILWIVNTAYSGANAVAGTLLNALTNNSQAIGGAVSNQTNKDRFANFRLNIKFQSNPSAGGYVALYIVYAVDGTNYGDGDASVAPPATAFVGNFPVRAVTTAQIVDLVG